LDDTAWYIRAIHGHHTPETLRAECLQSVLHTDEHVNSRVRLALGEVYAEKFGRQMLVLDDVLVYTDPERYGRMLEIMKIGAERLQIFVLTSHPQFYRGVVPEQFVFDLPSLAAVT
jgi:uncharacterized protein YhaN